MTNIEIVKELIKNYGITQEELYPTSVQSKNEPLYTILQFSSIDKDYVWKITKDGKYSCNGTIYWTLDNMLEDDRSVCVAKGTVLIHSVRRESDQEVFTIGNMITGLMGNSFQIDSFNIGNGNIWANPINSKCYTPIQNWKKIETFTTEDGVIISEAYYPVWVVHNNDGTYEKLTTKCNVSTIHYNEESGCLGPEGSYKIFSTVAAADEWILANNPKKVLLTTQDDIEITDPTTHVWGVHKAMLDYTIDDTYVISIGQINALWFSTEAARDEYIARNKRLFSIEDIKQWDDKQLDSFSSLLEIAKERINETS